MKNFLKAIALCMAMTILLAFPVGVSAAELDTTIINEDATGSLTIYKVDITNAEKDGVWDSSYISTGVYDQDVYDTLIGTGNTNNLGNGGTSHGYAIAGGATRS